MRFIHTGTTGVVQTFGRFTKTVGPGLHFYLPIVQQINVVSTRTHQDDYTLEVKSKDGVFTRIFLGVQYRVEPQNVETAYFTLAQPMAQINSYIENTVRAQASTMKLDQMFESQDDICRSVLSVLSQKMKVYGYTIESVLVKQIDPDKDVKTAMNRMNAAERIREATKIEADAAYISAVRQAEADRDRKALQGQGTSLQRQAILDGFCIGIENMTGKLGVSASDVMKLVLATQHMDAITNIATQRPYL